MTICKLASYIAIVQNSGRQLMNMEERMANSICLICCDFYSYIYQLATIYCGDTLNKNTLG